MTLKGEVSFHLVVGTFRRLNSSRDAKHPLLHNSIWGLHHFPGLEVRLRELGPGKILGKYTLALALPQGQDFFSTYEGMYVG